MNTKFFIGILEGKRPVEKSSWGDNIKIIPKRMACKNVV
jgi:hypothetical protein